jgi:23S rRNA (cytidine1920-2'-O)/16S rRNA (cytidine1409-2'-O)-methyltransferase
MADQGLVTSRSQAKSLIENGDVSVDGKIIKKAGELVDSSAKIEVLIQLYVGRGALKLEKALEVFQVEVREKVLLDVGASTGGFTEVLLNKGAQKVFAIDVGHDQLAQKLRNDPRVVNLEGTNIRELATLPELAHGAVMDLSFISITKVLGAVKSLLRPDGFLIALVKPQFEVGKEKLPKDGVVKDPRDQESALRSVIDFAKSEGWVHHGTIDSPIEGKQGNKEFLCWFTRS